MMKNNKKLTYLLLALSVVVWGIAGWKVYSAFHTEAPLPPTRAATAKPPAEERQALLLNYRDPFLGGYADSAPATGSTTVSATKSAASRTASPAQAPKPEEKPNVQFKGLMQVEKNTIAILQTANGTVSLKVGESVDGYKLIHVDSQKIILRKGTKRHEIPIR
ncbi:MAG: hypothetical protein LBN29_03360 [Mediterranea sp.]|jgi:hypothetical protein|nr:hypothetical protein [Mediterranea sp.]